jgi:hypothetical protein
MQFFPEATIFNSIPLSTATTLIGSIQFPAACSSAVYCVDVHLRWQLEVGLADLEIQPRNLQLNKAADKYCSPF